MAAMPDAGLRAGTLAAIWSRAVAEAPRRPAFLVPGVGGWREVSWEDAGRSVEELAAGFLALGIGREDRVAILSRTRLEWALCDWALIGIGRCRCRSTRPARLSSAAMCLGAAGRGSPSARTPCRRRRLRPRGASWRRSSR